MEQNQRKGQGALEYLLLIGGAVVVAAVVVVLILNLGATSTSSTGLQAVGAICSQKAAINNDCDSNASAGGTGAAWSTLRVVWYNGTCYSCQGTTPACTATTNSGTQAQCVSS